MLSRRHRRWHVLLFAALLTFQLTVDYSTNIPSVSRALLRYVYFHLHTVHQVQYIALIALACVLFGVRAGVVLLALATLSAIPFIFVTEVRLEPLHTVTLDALRAGIILLLGALVIVAFHLDQRRRVAEGAAAIALEVERVRANFMAMASHELRTPLQIIMMASALLHEKGLGDEEAAWVESIDKQSRIVSKLITDLLESSKADFGQLELRIEPVAAHALLRDAAETARPLLRRQHIAIDVSEELPPARCDRDKLLQVLLNLISNAIKYGPEDGNVRLAAHLAPEGDRLVISVHDEGGGISPEEQRQIFTPFYRSPAATKGGAPGVGLGLHIVKTLVEHMQGGIWVESTATHGTTFSVSLPIWDDHRTGALVSSSP